MIVKNVKELGELIRKTRKKMNFTQKQLAGICNVGVRFIVDIEKGKETCQIGKVIYVMVMLGLRINIPEVKINE
ncbi:MAG: helix-turn-helix domain-containing protein [Candidatus Muiribacteriota bacterium]|jgi:y4mF family transcriptional regulator